VWRTARMPLAARVVERLTRPRDDFAAPLRSYPATTETKETQQWQRESS
jgi:hypothetical protein